MKYYALLVIAFLLLAGCASQIAEEQMEQELEKSEDVDEAEVKIDESQDTAEVTVKGDDGDTKVTYEGENTDEWCQARSKWSMTGSEGAAEMIIVRLETSGEYARYCHVRYDVDMEGAQGNMDFYFNEEGAGYQVMDINGQKMKTEWQS